MANSQQAWWDDGGEKAMTTMMMATTWTMMMTMNGRCANIPSLDSLANLYGAEPVLPYLLALQQGLSSQDRGGYKGPAFWRWVRLPMAVGNERPFGPTVSVFDAILAQPEKPLNTTSSQKVFVLGRSVGTPPGPWNKSNSCARASAAHDRESLQRLTDRIVEYKVACGSTALSLDGNGWNLMIPYLEPIYQGLSKHLANISRPRGFSIIFITLGILVWAYYWRRRFTQAIYPVHVASLG
jgi:hypothetical protein